MTASLVDLALTDYVLIVGAAFVSSLISGVGGFGGAFLIVAVLTPVIGPKAVIALISVFAFCANISRIAIYRKTIEWRLALQIIAASLPGLWLGATFLKWVPETVFLGFLGASLIAAVPTRRYLKRKQFSPGLRSAVAIGFVFGIVSGASVGSGMYVIAALNSAGLQGPLLLGTDAVIGLINAGSRAVAFWWLDLLTVDLMIAGTLMGLVTFPGTWVASKIVHRLGHEMHSSVIEVVIAVFGAYFVYQSIMLL